MNLYGAVQYAGYQLDSNTAIDDSDAEANDEMQDNFGKVEKRAIEALLDGVLEQMAFRLDSVAGQIGRNKKRLRKCQKHFEVCKEVIETYQRSAETQNLTDVMRFYFALAKANKLEVVENSESKAAGEETDQTTTLPPDRTISNINVSKQTDDFFNKENKESKPPRVKVVSGHEKEKSPQKKDFQLLGLQKINKLELESKASKMNLELLKRRKVATGSADVSDGPEPKNLSHRQLDRQTLPLGRKAPSTEPRRQGRPG